MTEPVDNLLLAGLDGKDETLSTEGASSSDETMVEATDEDKHREMLQAAHDSLDGKTLSDISINHPYWGMMNAARQFKHEKGF